MVEAMAGVWLTW